MSVPQVLAINAACVAIIMLLLWLASLRLKDASIVDIFWGFGFVLIACITFVLGEQNTRAIVLTILTSLWGLRLSGYLAWRNHGKGEDPRYTAMRNYRGDSFWWFSLLTVFGLQGAVMWLVAWPVQVGQTTSEPLQVWNLLGIALWIVGFLFEAVGDYQLASFKANPENAGLVMDRGLWRYTRHPNYFGNAMIWWGLFLLGATASTAWLVISPLVMNFLLLKVSGVALLERSLKQRSAGYRDYIRRTSPFIPWPPKSPLDGGNP